MALYKGIELDSDLNDLIRHMNVTVEYWETLQYLQGVWDNLTLLGQLSGTGTDMTSTRQAFHRLTENLLNSLGHETLKKTVQEMNAKAQVAVDIMVRNLFERTADIGFLATDDDIRDYLEFVPAKRRELDERYSDDRSTLKEQVHNQHENLLVRFHEYARKYSVYQNIILLDTEGNVLAQLDQDNPVSRTHDPLLQASLNTAKSYVETFRHSDLCPNEEKSLIYSYRVTARDGETALGVLCLCFRFQNETESIFANLVDEKSWSVVTLLDAQGIVIASSEAFHIPVGAKLHTVLEHDWQIVRFAGRQYIATTRPTKGYQGYLGPGWYGHVMIPLEHAFEAIETGQLADIPREVLLEVTHNPALFSATLRHIPNQAEQIQRELNRSVWNGNVRQSSDRKVLNPAFSKVLLWEISNTGLKTKDVFERSIGNLHQTVVSAILQDSLFQASLAIDIMDRNLYERANDCRWWALTSLFRDYLAADAPTPEQTARMTDVLAQINSLYTVYSNLVLFDRHGRVIAVSNPDFSSLRGRQLQEDWSRQALALQHSQDYAVSHFVPTPLYHNRHTYIYAAAIHAPDDAGSVAGGIGVVFDSLPQFQAMLQDALPQDEHGEPMPGCFGVFADKNQHVIAATLDSLGCGDKLDIPDDCFKLKPGQGIAKIITFQGRHYAVGARMSSGYREYKGSADSYRNDVVALFFSPLGEAGTLSLPDTHTPKRQAGNHHYTANRLDGDSSEIATFYIGENWFGIPSQQVIEAIDATSLTKVPGTTEYVVGYLMFRGSLMPVVSLHQILQKDVPTAPMHAESQIVVIRAQEDSDYLGLLVDALGEIPEVSLSQIEKISPMLAGDNILAESIVKQSADEPCQEMLVVLSPDRICNRVMHAVKGQLKSAGRPAGAETATVLALERPAG